MSWTEKYLRAYDNMPLWIVYGAVCFMVLMIGFELYMQSYVWVLICFVGFAMWFNTLMSRLKEQQSKKEEQR